MCRFFGGALLGLLVSVKGQDDPLVFFADIQTELLAGQPVGKFWTEWSGKTGECAQIRDEDGKYRQYCVGDRGSRDEKNYRRDLTNLFLIQNFLNEFKKTH